MIDLRRDTGIGGSGISGIFLICGCFLCFRNFFLGGIRNGITLRGILGISFRSIWKTFIIRLRRSSLVISYTSFIILRYRSGFSFLSFGRGYLGLRGLAVRFNKGRDRIGDYIILLLQIL